VDCPTRPSGQTGSSDTRLGYWRNCHEASREKIEDSLFALSALSEA
jgi:hypothetical protein